MLDLTDLVGWLDWFDIIDVLAVCVGTGWLDWYDWLRWLLGSVRLPWLCLDGIIGFIWFGCIALGLLRLDSIHRLQVDWLGQNISAQPNPTSAKQQIDTSQPSRMQSHRIQCNQPRPFQSQPITKIHAKQTNAMQPNPMNPMMPSKHSQGNRNNPSSQHNQSYQSNQPVKASKAMTSIITNQSSQPTKSIKSSMQTINPQQNKSHGLGLDANDHIGLYEFVLDGIFLCCLIEFMVFGWADIVNSIWFGLVALDCVGYALSGLYLIHWFVSFHLLRFHLTWLIFQFITLIDWFVFDFVVFCLCSML